MDDAALYHARAQAMIDFAEGRITETEERYDQLLQSQPALTPMQEISCRLDRSTVRGQANRWHDALDDLATCDDLTPRLVPVARTFTMTTILHAKVKLFSDPLADTYDLAAAASAVEQLRRLSPISWLAEELESGIALQQGEWERCIQRSSTAVHLLEAEGWRKPVAVLRRRMGEAHTHLNQFELAEQDLRAAYTFFTEFGSPDDLARTELAVARLESQRGDHDEAWNHALASLGAVEQLIRNFRVVAEQQQFLKDKLQFYDDCFDIGIARGGEEGLRRAWTIAERAKSFYLCQLLANADVRLFDGVNPESIERLHRIEATLDMCARAVLMSGSADREAKEHEQLKVSAERQKLLSTIMKENPRWGAVRAPIRASIEEILRALPAPWVPISYFWRDRKDRGADVFLFYAGFDRRIQMATVPWSREAVSVLDECRQVLWGDFGPQTAQSEIDRFQQSLRKLFPNELIGELGRNPHARLLISPHARLRGLPLHALDFGGEDYVIRHWPVQYIPTLSMITVPRATSAAEKVLLMGCPLTPLNPGELTGVQQEIEALDSLWQGKRPGLVDSCVVPFEGSPAQAGFPISEWGKYQLTHFSCHGIFPAQQPFDAALLLGSDAVRATELFAVRLQASLVTLSACHLGKQGEVAGTSGDEWIGLYIPLLYAGAGRLLVSLWEADASTAERVMLRLHSLSADGVAAAEALQLALCDEIDSSLFQLWANWYLVGIPADVGGRTWQAN